MSKLDGKFALGDHTLTFNVNTFCDLEDHFEAQDVNEVLGIIQGLETNPSLKVIRGIFYVALQQEHPEMTERDAGNLISEVGIAAASEALSEAVSQAFPDDSGEEVGNAPKRKKKAGGSGPKS